jgi:hypothetical protein
MLLLLIILLLHLVESVELPGFTLVRDELFRSDILNSVEFGFVVLIELLRAVFFVEEDLGFRF